VLPRAQRNPAYLASEDMEIVQGGGDDARPVAVTPEHLAMLRDGRLRLRQRAGPKNALGRVKFVFPNDADVYLHDTPAQALFGRARRDFSHGCVRLELPLQLAEWVLAEEPGWTRERIEAAASGPAVSLRVPLHRPMRVLLFYMTAMVVPEDGSVHFADDVYGHDARLQRALAARAPR
jgi:murein L,D-transpeptidase YcbB/YkuD